jgi:outer membrane protein OmpA-like peptidoglycan-associated protein
MAAHLSDRHPAPEQTHWIPLADLMTGLMMVFLLVAITYMVKVEAASQNRRDIAVLYERMKIELYEDLRRQFEKDLPKWGAEIDSDSTIRFKEPDVLFPIGSSDLKGNFKSILDDFFPRYVYILSSDKYRDAVEEIRIEGHTSSIWSNLPSDQAYFQNMKLSQDRTRSTLQYVLALPAPAVRNDLPWLRGRITANGLSSSKTIKRPDGFEDYERSQRVEFRVRTDAESRIVRIIEAGK